MISSLVLGALLIVVMALVVIDVAKSVPRRKKLIDWTKEWKRAHSGDDRFRREM